MDDLPGSNGDGPPENRAIEDKGVEFAVFAAGVGAGREIAKKRVVEFASGEAGIENLGINANGGGAETLQVEKANEFARVTLPNREKSGYPHSSKVFFAVGAQVFEENVAKGDFANAPIVENAHGLLHARFVDGVDAMRRNANFVERQTDGFDLALEKLAANTVHADAFVALSDGCQESGHAKFLLLEKRVERHGAVFAAAPAEENGFACGHKSCQSSVFSKESDRDLSFVAGCA